jgi:hypothetical protein
MNAARIRSRWPVIVAGLLLAANVVIPLLGGDVYPFTSAPMFRDSPRQYCNYKVYAPNGEELPAENWRLNRVYDGNPVGYGVGIRPPAVLEQQFGVIHEEATVREHIARQFANPKNREYDFVDVVQETVGPVDGPHVGIIGSKRWRIEP